MHNNIIADGSRDHPPMLATGRYAQWQSRFMRYVDTKPNGDALRKCILQGPYKLSNVKVLAQPATDDAPAIPEHTVSETLLNISEENKAHLNAEKEAIHLFYKMMNKMVRNQLEVSTMQVNVQFIQQLQPEWSRFMTIVKQTVDLDKESYDKLFDILKKYQKEVNEICAKKIARNANPLAFVANAQPYPDPYYQALKPQRSYAPTSNQSSSTRSQASTRYKGKEIAKPITPLSESASEEDNDLEQAQKDKEMHKNLALIVKYFKKLYKPTNNNLGTSSNSKNKNVDNSPRYKNDNQTGKFGNQGTETVAGARETVGSQVVQQTGIHCFNCKEFRHFAKECRKPKSVKDYMYHKEKMLLCKQAEKGVQLQAEQADWLEDTDEEIDEQELEAHYSYMAKIQEVLPTDSDVNADPLEEVQYDDEYNVFANNRQYSEQPESISNTCVVETIDSNVIPDSSDMCNNDDQTDQNAVKFDDERAALANLIANLKLDVDENKKIQKQLKKANASLSHELEKTNRLSLRSTRLTLIVQQNLTQLNKYDELVIQSLLTKSNFEGLVKEKNKVIKDLKAKEGNDIDKMISMEKQLKFLNEIVYKRNQSIQTIHIFAPDREETLTLDQESRSKLKKDLVKPYDYSNKTVLNKDIIVDLAWDRHTYDKFRTPTTKDIDSLLKVCLMPLALKTQNDSFTFVHELKQEMFADLQYVQSLEKEIDELESDKADFSNIYDLLLQECVSKDVMCSYLHSLSDLDAHTELQCLYLHKVKECECLAEKISKQTTTMSRTNEQ
ncbi:retrovirus-related pol polyprotein from transposon TNT 1-94 [Tanacetum coccineum]